MNQTLILFTSNFPFGSGETFLETELPYLARSFSKVFIIPTQGTLNEHCRPIPENCSVDTSLLQKKKTETDFKRVVSKFFTSLFFFKFYRDLSGVLSKGVNKSTIDRLLTFSRDAVWAKRLVNQLIETKGLDRKKTITYTYWCSGSTFGATLNHYSIPVISRIHRGDLYEELYPKNYIPFRKSTLARLTALCSISEDGIKYLSKKYPAFEHRFFLYRLGIPIPKIFPAKSTESLSTFVVASCSSINENKRVLEIADALQQFTVNYPTISVMWHHFGGGPLFDQLKRLSANFPVNLKTTLHGHIQNKTLLEWYAEHSVDLFINLSKSEGIPVSIMEANSFGIPAIATNVGGTAELVSNTNGWLLSGNFSEAEINQVFEQAFFDHTMRYQKSIEARKKCTAYFDAKKNYPSFCNALLQFLESNKISADT